MKWWDWMPWSSFFECWVLSQLFHSLLLPSSRSSFILIKKFLFKGGVICISEVVNISPSNHDSSLWFIQPGIFSNSLWNSWKIFPLILYNWMHWLYKVFDIQINLVLFIEAKWWQIHNAIDLDHIFIFKRLSVSSVQFSCSVVSDSLRPHGL